MLEQEASKKSRKKFYLLAIGILIIVIVVGIFSYQQNQILMQLQAQADAKKQADQQLETEKQSINNVSVEVTQFNWTKSSLSFTADIEFKIYNNGELQVSLDKATTTLYINDINVQAKGFQSQVLVIPAQSFTTYTGTYGTFDSNNAGRLQSATSFKTQLDLSAMATCGSYSSAISVSHQETWYPIS
jgi:LEA14-like dessication related protein